MSDARARATGHSLLQWRLDSPRLPMHTPEKSANTPLEWFVSCAKGLEPVLAAEIQSLGGYNTREVVAGLIYYLPL